MAAELLEIYAKREAQAGEPIHVPEDEFDKFCRAFPFEETPDQETAIHDVVNDLGGKRPMDRLVCGDVGFGKTEVAMRAAFLAVQSGRQVAVLVPTTLLAEQHHQSFQDRFAGWPIVIESLSRFKTKKEQGGGVNHDMHEITVQQDPEENTYKTQTVSGQNSILIKSKSNEMI